MGEGILKPFLELQGKTILERVVETFSSVARFENIVVLANPDSIENFERILDKFDPKVKFTEGGATRQESVRLGLEYLDRIISHDEENYVAIHDAARCLIERGLIENALDECLGKKAVTLGIPLTDSVFKTEENAGDVSIQASIERKSLFAIQTPQVFQYELISERHKHFKKAERNDFTDDCALLDGFHKVYIVPGSKNNLKITTKEDLVFAKAVLENSKL